LARFAAAIILLFLTASPALGALGSSSEDAPSAERGPFEERNQLPFNLLFLAFPSRGGRTLPRGEQQFVVGQTYANTMIGSDIFFTDLNLASDERQRLSPAFVASAQAAEPGRSLFFLDLEQARTELRWRAGVLRWLELGVEVPFLSYRGGAFDGPIESYHRGLGLPSGGRELFIRDAVALALTLDDEVCFAGESPSLFQIGDVSLFGRIPLRQSARGDLALSAAVKLPTGKTRSLGGSGGTDYGLELEGTGRWGRQRLHVAAGWVQPGDWSLFPRFEPAAMWSLLAGYEVLAKHRLSWIVQVQSQQSVFRELRQADPDLSMPSTELLVGLKRSGRDETWTFEAAVIEGLFNQNNGVDIGIRTGVVRRFPGR
jgi:uncharacterized protein DUF3187